MKNQKTRIKKQKTKIKNQESMFGGKNQEEAIGVSNKQFVSLHLL